jgi:hypothetical protein
VDRTVRVETVGHRATPPRANGPDMEELGVRWRDVQALQRKLHVVYNEWQERERNIDVWFSLTRLAVVTTRSARCPSGGVPQAAKR